MSNPSTRELNSDIPILWNDLLETRLLELYTRSDVVDIFWGRRFDEKKWSVYVITRGAHDRKSKTEIITNGPDIHIIAEESAFAEVDLSSKPEVIPPSLQEEFDKALDEELGIDFRKAHYNLIGMSIGYKWKNDKKTTTPAVLLFVRQKGILRRGCDGLFRKEIRGFPTDVIEAMPAIAYCGSQFCRAFQSEVALGASIGRGITYGQTMCGTLGVIAQKEEQIGIISCQHVLKYEEPGTEHDVFIHQPSPQDHLIELELQWRGWNELAKTSGPGTCDDLIINLKNAIDLAKRQIERNETKFVSYVTGFRENKRSAMDQKNYGVDAAFASFVDDNRRLRPTQFSIPATYFGDIGLAEEIRLRGYYSLEDLKNLDREGTKIFKVGRTTGLTAAHLASMDATVATEIPRMILKQAYSELETNPGANSEAVLSDDQDIFIGYMKSSLDSLRDERQKCFPICWFDRQIVVSFKSGDFEPGDSGASVIDENGIVLGILHAQWNRRYSHYAIASPFFAVQEALGVNLYLANEVNTNSYS